MNASITDMGEWLKLLLGNYPEIMDGQSLDEVFAPRVNTRRDYRYYNKWPGFRDSHYAIGWRVLDLGDRTLVHHGGYVNGYRSEIAIDRENKIAICALFNSPCAYAKEVVPNFFEFVDRCSVEAFAAP
jgi:beta-lactamase class C